MSAEPEVITDVPQDDFVSPFEGPEKLLEIWFAPSCEQVASDDDVVDDKGVTRSGLRRVPRESWEEMLKIVKCQVLSVIEGIEMDAYLLSESSLFISPHKLILKTCGTTLNLLGLPKILEIAAPKFPSVHRLFYSRKSFMFPERQQGPHREWREEVSFLDKLFGPGHEKGARGLGAAYTVGSVNRDHWLLYLTGPPDDDDAQDAPPTSTAEEDKKNEPNLPDYTLEILMSRLSAPARRPFFFPESEAGVTSSSDETAAPTPHHLRGQKLSHELGVLDLFPVSQTTLDAFVFEPCGYSANGLVRHDDGEGYYTIHVTPEEGWSYASFECNVPLPPPGSEGGIPDLETLIQRVVKIFQPGHLTVTLFASSSEVEDSAMEYSAQKTMFKALTAKELGFNYKRVDKINYEFGGYDLAFASFEKKAGWQHQADWKIEVVPTENS